MSNIFKNSFEIAISVIITLILSVFLAMLGSAVGGFISYLIIKKANSDEIKGFKQSIIPLSLIAVLSVILFFVTTSFFIKLSDTIIGQFLHLEYMLAAGDKSDTAVIMMISIILGVINISVFMLSAYASSKIIR